MTTTLTEMNITHAQGGGAYLPVENPMNPSPSIQQQLESIHQTPAQALAERGWVLNRQGGGPPSGPPDDDDDRGGGGPEPPRPPRGEGLAFILGAQFDQGLPCPAPSKHLVGHVATFDGDRAKAQKFEKQFGLYRLLNMAHPLISVPMQRVALALTYIEGPKVDRWSQAYANKLAGQVYSVHGQPAQFRP